MLINSTNHRPILLSKQSTVSVDRVFETNELGKLREALAIGLVISGRPASGGAGDGRRWSVV